MMKLEIISTPLSLNIYGFSGTVIGKDYTGTAFKLMDRMWKTVKSNNLQNKGLNIWVYEPSERMFAGVELDGSPQHDIGLEQKSITLTRYAYHKHIGAYQLIKQKVQAMKDQLKENDFKISYPHIEIYGIGQMTRLNWRQKYCCVLNRNLILPLFATVYRHYTFY